jgi:prolyl 4-hydroxylase
LDNLVDYIRVYDEVLDIDTCADLIELFDRNEVDEINKHLYRLSSHQWVEDYRRFTEADITAIEAFKPYVMPLYACVGTVYDWYERDCGKFFPQDRRFESLRMKRYDNNDKDQFGWHVDVGDHSSARRYLVMFFYLNEVRGGETVFEFNNKYSKMTHFTVNPKPGRIVVFPPMWMFPHKGMKPIGGPKYIISTYAHYK